MSLSDIVKRNNELKNNILPDSVQNIIDFQQRFPQSLLKRIHGYSFLKNLKRGVIYSNLLAQIDSSVLSQPNTSILDPDSVLNTLLFKEYDLEEISSEGESADTKEKSRVVNESNRIKKIITDIYYDNSTLLKIGPRQFEEMIAELLYSQGFEVQLTKQTRDNGYDILALKGIKGLTPMKVLVECKRFSSKKVGIELIRSFKEVLATEDANRGIIVTTSYFTRDAQKKQKETPYLLDFKDKDQVIQWVEDYKLNV